MKLHDKRGSVQLPLLLYDRTNRQLVGHGFFDLLDGLGDGFAQDAAAGLGDEDVVLDADTAKVFPLLKFVEVDKVFVGAFGMPFVDEGGNEVAAGLVGDYEAGLELATAAEAGQTKLVGGTGLIIVAHINLTIVLHIMDIQAHHVAEAVRHEETVSAISYDIINIALEDAEVFIALSQDLADGGMDLLVGDAGAGDADAFELRGKHDFVDGALTIVELTTNGHGTGDVGAVVHGSFATGIHHQHTAELEFVVVAVVVEGFAVDSHDHGEAYGAVALPSLALHETGEFILVAAGHSHLHGTHMHVVGGFDSLFDLNDFLSALDAALFDTSGNKLHGGIAANGIELDAEELAHLAGVVGAIGGQVVNLASLAYGLGAEGLQSGKVTTIVDTYAGGKFLDAGQRTGPDHIVDIIVVGKDVVNAIVAVEHAHQIFALEAEEIEESAVLTEPICIIGIVARGFVVALDDNKAVAYVFAQLFTTSDIGFFAKHVNYF